MEGMVAITRLSDGGYVDVQVSSSVLHVQKYGADGLPIGPEFSRTNFTGTATAVALSDGGYGLGYNTTASSPVTRVHTFDAGGGLESTPITENTGGPFNIAAMPNGGFVVSFSSADGVDNSGSAVPRVTYFQQFDNAGAPVTAAVPLLGSTQPNAPAISITGPAAYTVSWYDGFRGHSIDVNPANPPDLTPPAAPGLKAYDDVGPRTGEFVGVTDDATPTVRIAVSEPGWFRLEGDPVYGNGFGSRFMADQAITSQDLARGYAEVKIQQLYDNAAYNLTVRVADANGIASAQTQIAIRIDLTAPDAPSITQVMDDTAPQAGGVGRGESTNDATPTVYVTLNGAHAVVGDTVQLVDNGQAVGAPVSLVDGDLARGYVAITAPTLASGGHSFQARVTDQAGNVGALSGTYAVTVSASGDDTPRSGGGDGGLYFANTPARDTFVGGSGADTLVAGREGDQLTGGTGADVFVLSDLPYAVGRINDFTPGTDRLDLTALARMTNYTGSDPIADRVMRLESDGAGGTRLLWDGRGGGQNAVFQVTVLAGVSPNGLSYARLTQTSSDPADPPPPPPPPDGAPSTGDGQVLTSDQYADRLVGGAGNDTLVAGQGPDTLTGAGGGDAFVYRAIPWNAGHVTDFAIGADRLDLKALFQESGYAGANPVADRYISFESDGAGGTRVFYDTDGAGAANTMRFLITTLDGVATPGLTWSHLSGAGNAPAPPPPPPPPPSSGSGGAGQVLTANSPNASLTGGAGDDTLNAGQGTGTFTGNGGADLFVFAKEPWAPGHIADFTPGVDRIDFRAMFDAIGYAGTDPFADGRMWLIDDGAGGTKVLLDRDGPGPNPEWPNYILTIDHVAPSQLHASDWLFQ